VRCGQGGGGVVGGGGGGGGWGGGVGVVWCGCWGSACVCAAACVRKGLMGRGSVACSVCGAHCPRTFRCHATMVYTQKMGSGVPETGIAVCG